MNKKSFMLARVTDDNKGIIDSDGNIVDFYDPRVVHVWTIDMSKYFKAIAGKIYQKRGLKFRACKQTDQKVIQDGKKICTGRECIPINAMAGLTYQDIITNRSDNEITLYYCMNQIGPCQNGAWSIIFENYAKRNAIKNVLFLMSVTKKNIPLAFDVKFLKDFITSYVISDILDEAESSLVCLAENKKEAMDIFKIETEELIESTVSGNFESALKKWALKVKEIPRRYTLKDVPKILLFGGLNQLFTHRAIMNYLNKEDIIVKDIDISEGALWLISEGVVRSNVKLGILSVKDQFKIFKYFKYIFKYKIKEHLKSLSNISHNEQLKYNALRSFLAILLVESRVKKYRKIAKSAELIFDKYIPYKKLAVTGDKYVTNNAFTETSITIGRYVNTLKSGIFNGLVYIGSFDCQPAQNSLAVIRSIADKNDIPFVSIECDGSDLTSNQIRLLETLIVQVKRNYNATKAKK